MPPPRQLTRFAMSSPSSTNEQRFNVAQVLALVAVVFTWPLLIVGGVVSVNRLGMAVPDWPTTFGLNMFVYNMFEASRAVFAEHSHRLYGSLVGLACLGLASFMSVKQLGWRGLGLVIAAVCAAGVAALNPVGGVWGLRPFVVAMLTLGTLSALTAIWAWYSRRDTELALAWLALAAVVVQGALGGARVVQNSPTFAFVHGVFGQVVFALLVVLWVVTGNRWRASHPTFFDPINVRRWSFTTLLLVFMQIVLGAYVRHFGSPIALFVHAVVALGVLAHVGLLAFLTPREREFRDQLRLRSPIAWMSVWALAQVVLGIGATLVLWPFDGLPRDVDRVQAFVRIAHQGVGALLFASSTVLALRAWHVLSDFDQAASTDASFSRKPVAAEVGA